MPERKIIDFDRNSVTVTGLNRLTPRLGRKYLLATETPYPNQFLAKQWKESMPKKTKSGEAIIRF